MKLALLSLALFVSSQTAVAREVTPVRDYPATTRGMCERLHERPMVVKGASTEEIAKLCGDAGIAL